MTKKDHPVLKHFERARNNFEHHKTETSSNVHDADECDIILKNELYSAVVSGRHRSLKNIS